jgi:predicted amidohydrolase YtcJ
MATSLDEQEAVTIQEALAMYTRWAAYAIGLDDEIGSLEVGKNADFVVLDHDLTTTDIAELDRIGVLATWVGGREVYRHADALTDVSQGAATQHW